MSKYTDDMKRALQTYRDTKKKVDDSIKQVVDLYGEEAGTYERERQEKQLAAARTRAEAEIREAYSEGHYLAEQWGKPDGSQLTDDLKLFEAGMVTPDVFETLKARYRDNATMSAALKAQGEKLNAAAAQADREKGGLGFAEPYNVRDITTGADKVNGWDKLKKQALDTLDMIDGKGAYSDPWNKALGNALSDQTIEHFGEGSGL
jgi:hypothetical protein